MLQHLQPLLGGIILLYYLVPTDSVQSVWDVTIDPSKENSARIFPNYLYANDYVAGKIVCASRDKDEDAQVAVTWILRQVSCMEEMYRPNLTEYRGLLELDSKADKKQKSKKKMLVGEQPNLNTTGTDREDNSTEPESPRLPPIAFQISSFKMYPCGRHNIIELEDESNADYRKIVWPEDSKDMKVVTMKRDAKVNSKARQVIVSAWESGMYHFQLAILPTKVNQTFQAQVLIEMHGKRGYLSAIDWPLLPFNGVMAFLYLALSTVWIMVWARSHRFTLKIHIAMGIVAVQGAMGATLMFVQNAAENSLTGGVPIIMWFARIISVLQLAFLNLILMIVSTGYGISAPGLPRSTLVKMSAICILQFLLGITWLICTDTTLLVQYSYPTFTKVTLWLKVAVFAVIAAWIMVSSIKTLIHLRQRRHAGLKIVTFTIFMVSCIIAFIVYLTVFGLSLGWMQACRTHWELQWVFNSVTHMEAFLLLIVLMILWRPVDTAQSYAFAPLGMEQVDEGSEDEEESENEVYSKETDKFKLDDL